MKTAALATLLALAVAACGAEGDQAGDGVVDISDGDELVIVAGQPLGISTESGFAIKGEEFTTPGPTIRMRKGDTVTITFENGHYCDVDHPCLNVTDGRPFWEPHNWTIVADKDVPVSQMEPLWGAHVGGFGDELLAVGERGSVTFTAEDAGSFYYVCAFSDHTHRGMWGRFIVEE